MPDFQLTWDILQEVARMPPKPRAKAMRKIGELEYEKCSRDFFYWVNHEAHVKTPQWPSGLPYVFTFDPKPLYKCKLCPSESMLAYYDDKRKHHLEVTHHASKPSYQEVTGAFEALSRKRPYPPMSAWGTSTSNFKPIFDTCLMEKVVLVEKSRDVLASWSMLVLHAWDTYFHPLTECIFQADKGPKACELVSRAAYILKNQPAFLQIHAIQHYSGTSHSGELHIPEIQSKILGFPQGPDQIRLYHPTRVFIDEAAFHVEARAGFQAVQPAIRGGGKYIAISSPNVGFFQAMVQDTMNEEEEL